MSSRHGRAIGPCLALVSCLLLPGPLEARIAIERAQRAFQARYYFATGSYVMWPACPCNKITPHKFPADDYYGDEVENEQFASTLVADLAGKVLNNLGGAMNGYVELDFIGSTNTVIPTIPLPADLRPVTTANYALQFRELHLFLQRLTHLKVTPTWTGDGTFPDPAEMWTRHIDVSGGLDPEATCMDFENDLDSSYAADAGWIGGPYAKSEAGILVDTEGMSVNWGYTVIKGRITADLTNYARYPGEGTCYVRVQEGVNGFGPSQLPDGLIEANTWQELTSGGDPVPGSVYTSDAMPDSGGDPPPYTSGCTNGREGWSLPYVTIIIQPEFETDPDLGETCAELCCPSCPTVCNQPGRANAELGSIRVRLPLGAANYGFNGGFLYLSADKPHPGLTSPAALRDAVRDVELIYDLGALRQAMAVQCLADIVVLDAYSYDVRYYHDVDIGPKSNGLYTVNGGAPPFSIVTIENPDGGGSTNRFRITSDFEGSVTVYEYVWDETSQTLLLRQGGGPDQRIESLAVAWTIPGVERMETFSVLDSASNTVFKRTDTYRVFLGGEELVVEVIDPDDQALTTTWSYYEDALLDGDNYSRVKEIVQPGGNWERHEYDLAGRVTNTVTQFLDAPQGAPENQSRVFSIQYGTHNGNALVTEIEFLLGQEIARTHRMYPIYEDRLVQCAEPGASPDATNALRTLTYRSSPGLMEGEPIRIEHADGTLTLYEYQFPSFGRRTKRSTGEPAGNGLSVVDGARHETTVNVEGGFSLARTYDLPTSILLSQRQTTATDEFGRPLQIDSLSGTSETFTYNCCGLETLTEGNGVVTTFVRDEQGRIVEQERLGIRELFEYDALGNVARTTRRGSDSSEVTVQQSVFNTAGDLVATFDALSNMTTRARSYAGAHRIETTTYPNGGTEIREFYGDGSLYEVRGTAAAPVRFEYSVSNILHDGVSINATYVKTIALDALGDPTLEWMIQYSDMLGRAIRTEYPDGAVAEAFFNANGQIARTVSEAGDIRLFTYNGAGELQDSVIDMNGDGQIDYGGTDRVTRVTESALFAHSTYVRRTRTEEWIEDNNPSNTLIVSERDVSRDGLRAWITDNGVTTEQITSYEGSGRRTETVAMPDGSFAVSTYQDGRLVGAASTNASSQQISRVAYAYGPHGRLQTVTDAATGATDYSYDNADRVITATLPPASAGEPPQVFTNLYDAAGRAVEFRGPGGTITNVYELSGVLLRQYGAQTYPVEYAYDTQGRLKTMTTWRDFGGDAGRAVTTWHYDPLRGFLAGKEDDAGKQVTYTYNSDGTLATRTWARGTQTSYGYNAAGQRTLTDYADGTADLMYSYDRRGSLRTVTDALGTQALEYDLRRQLTNATWTSGPLAGARIDRVYDALNRPVVVSAGVSAPADLHAFGYEYDSASRLAGVISGVHRVRYAFAPDTRLISSSVYSNGAAAVMQVLRGYDALNRLTNIVTSSSAGPATLDSYAYAYNQTGQRIRVDLLDGTYWEYGYDDLGQLTDAVRRQSNGAPYSGFAFGYSYDDIGNRATAAANGRTSSYAANLLNQYTSRSEPGAVDVTGSADAGAVVTVNNQPVTRHGEYFHGQPLFDVSTGDVYAAVTTVAVGQNEGPGGQDIVAESSGRRYLPADPEMFTYDEDGNLLSDGRWTYTWNAENRLIQMETRTDLQSGAPRTKLDFMYDFFGRRTQKQVFDWDTDHWSPVIDHYFVYDGWNLIAELDALDSLSPVRTYTWGLDLSGSVHGAGGIGGLLSLTLHDEPGAPTLYAANDGHGNIALLLDAQTGEQTAAYKYDPFGETVSRTGSYAEENPFTFSTRYADDETELLYYGYRYLRPGIGRWLSRDPLGERAGLNLAGFAGNNAVNYVDLLGLALYAFDGTGNTYEQQTHVGILHSIYDGLREYEKGVGTSFRSLLDNKVIGGITGYGGRARLESMYQKFKGNWESGDRDVDIIGFSRGAALAREFANILHERGYEKHPSTRGRVSPKVRERLEKAKCPVEIRFMGLFDTVASFGVPGNRINRGITLGIPPNVKKVAHAVARDEKRALFPASLLNDPQEGQDFSEVVFPGDHSDIGGGYEDKQNYLAEAPLRYVWSQGRSVEVPFGDLPRRNLRESADPHDRSRDPRQRLGALLLGDPHDKLKPVQSRNLELGRIR